jgi:hypothetical protein
VAATIVHGDDLESAASQADAVAVACCGTALGHWMCERSILIAEIVKLPAVAHLNLSAAEVIGLLDHQDTVRTAMESMVP